MVLGIDLIFLESEAKNQGISTYTLGLVNALLKKKVDIIIFCNPENLKFIRQNTCKKFKYKILVKKKKIIHKMINYFLILLGYVYIRPLKIFKIINDFFYSDIKNMIDENCNVLINPLVTLSVYNLKTPTILSMHDIMQTRYPNFFTIFQRNERFLTYYNSAKHCTRLIASSNFMKREFKNYFKIKNKISIIEEGVDLFKAKNKKLNLPSYIPKNFILYPAQLWPHKNHNLLINAVLKFNKIYNSNIKLVLTGGKKNFYKLLKKIIDSNKKSIFYLGSVPRKLLNELYINAQAVVIPSLYESSSLVLYEAMYFKKDVILSNIGPFLEKRKQFNLTYFNVNDEKSLINTFFNFFMKNKKLNKKERKKNFKNLNKNSWDKISSDYLKIVKKII